MINDQFARASRGRPKQPTHPGRSPPRILPRWANLCNSICFWMETLLKKQLYLSPDLKSWRTKFSFPYFVYRFESYLYARKYQLPIYRFVRVHIQSYNADTFGYNSNRDILEEIANEKIYRWWRVMIPRTEALCEISPRVKLFATMKFALGVHKLHKLAPRAKKLTLRANTLTLRHKQ